MIIYNKIISVNSTTKKQETENIKCPKWKSGKPCTTLEHANVKTFLS